MRIEMLAKWGAPVRVARASGPMDRRVCDCPTSVFTNAWKRDRTFLEERGVMVWPSPNGTGVQLIWEVPAGTIVSGVATIPAAPPEQDVAIPSEIKAKLLPWQPPLVKKLAASLLNNSAALDACGTGVGKTTAALAAFASAGIRNVVVACPINVIPAWITWGEKFGILVRAYNYERLIRGNDVIHRNRKTFRWMLNDRTGLVFDEGHRIGGIDSLNSRLGQAVAERGIPTLIASATVADSPLRLLAPGEILGLFRRQDYWTWAIDHGCDQGGPRRAWQFSGSSAAMSDIHRSIFGAGKGVKLNPDQIPGFPEASIQPLMLDVGRRITEIRNAYINIESAAMMAIADKSVNRSQVQKYIASQWQMVEMAKLDATIEHLLDQEDEGNAIALFVRFRATAIEAAKRLGCGLIIGQQDPDERRAALEDFQTDRSTRLVATVDCGGEAISAHDVTGVHPRYAGVYLPWSSTKFRQTIGRFRRAGSKTKSNIRIGIAYGTAEMEIAERLTRKLDCLDALTDSDFCPGRSEDTRALLAALEE